jgi:hypothetical protein
MANATSSCLARCLRVSLWRERDSLEISRRRWEQTAHEDTQRANRAPIRRALVNARVECPRRQNSG